MGIRPTDRIGPPPDVEIVRRIEPDSEAQEFGQKERPAHRAGQRRSGGEEAPEQDTVEVSAQYQATGTEEEAPRADSTDPSDGSALPERHVDIQA